jgi:molybdopterin converting factor small subunit
MKISFYLFASARELCNTQSVVINDFKGLSLEDAIRDLQQLHPVLTDEYMNICMFSRNLKYIKNRSIKLEPNDIIYVIPPISGG